MKLLATIHETQETTWRIRISSRKNPEKPEGDIISKWTPNTSNAESMLIFNPMISLVVRNRFDTQKSILIPMTMFYPLGNILSVCYNGLANDKLYKQDGNTLYMDGNQAKHTARKLSCFKDVLVLHPCVISTNSGDLKGIRIINASKDATIGDLRHQEVRDLIEKISHMDIQTYTLVLSLLDQLDQMDQKLDRMISLQTEILGILKSEGIPKKDVKIKNDDFDWNIAKEDQVWDSIPQK